ALNGIGRGASIKIKFGSSPGVNVNILSSTSLEVTTPAHNPGLVDINIDLIIEPRHNPSLPPTPIPIPGTSSLQFNFV
ncbi:MAG TPA: hypothetical protein ENK52_03445, partial [Saprospiraceae bacterium]|nr:hypothetical protein [Saprospiraceae bacterium]